MSLVLFFAVVVLFFALPLLPALRELRHPTDAKPLDVFQGNAADAQEPVLKAKRLLAEKPGILPSELLAATGTMVLPESFGRLPRHTLGATSVLTAGSLALREVSQDLIALSARDMTLLSGARVEQALHCEGRATLQNDVVLRMLQAADIVVGSEAQEPREVAQPAPLAQRGAVQGATWHELQGWWHSSAGASIAPNAVIEGDVIVAQDLLVGEGAVVTGSIKAGGCVTLDGKAQVLGNCVARDVHIGQQACVVGSVVADESVLARAGAQVGLVDKKASVVAKTISLYRGTRIFGGITAHAFARTI